MHKLLLSGCLSTLPQLCSPPHNNPTTRLDNSRPSSGGQNARNSVRELPFHLVLVLIVFIYAESSNLTPNPTVSAYSSGTYPPRPLDPPGHQQIQLYPFPSPRTMPSFSLRLLTNVGSTAIFSTSNAPCKVASSRHACWRHGSLSCDLSSCVLSVITQNVYGACLSTHVAIYLNPWNRYDSVIFTGRLAWQDRLNSLNLPFFLASTGFFTNYTVRTTSPCSFLQLKIMYSGAQTTPLSRPNTSSLSHQRSLHTPRTPPIPSLPSTQVSTSGDAVHTEAAGSGHTKPSSTSPAPCPPAKAPLSSDKPGHGRPSKITQDSHGTLGGRTNASSGSGWGVETKTTPWKSHWRLDVYCRMGTRNLSACMARFGRW